MVNKSVNRGSRSNIGEIIPHIVQTACAFKSSITLEVGSRHVNAKSIMGVMALASQEITNINISADGTDESEAIRAITGLFE
ncbi:MAG: HPr family phosphocarrier protein [Lachnospiraceae bacterium]|nr:HPr family phosphocarrier protein [Lachnospiraceae bacterium]